MYSEIPMDVPKAVKDLEVQGTCRELSGFCMREFSSVPPLFLWVRLVTAGRILGGDFRLGDGRWGCHFLAHTSEVTGPTARTHAVWEVTYT